MYHISLSGIRFLQNEEGCILHPYHGKNDPPGVITIYTGHVVREGETFRNTQEEADQVLRQDLGWVQGWLYRNCPWTATTTNRQHQFDACCSFVFNEGRIWPELLALVNSEQPVDVGVLTRTWCKYDIANGVKGVLHFRRLKELALYLTPDVPADVIDRDAVLAQVNQTARDLTQYLIEP